MKTRIFYLGLVFCLCSFFPVWAQETEVTPTDEGTTPQVEEQEKGIGGGKLYGKLKKAKKENERHLQKAQEIKDKIDEILGVPVTEEEVVEMIKKLDKADLKKLAAVKREIEKIVKHLQKDRVKAKKLRKDCQAYIEEFQNLSRKGKIRDIKRKKDTYEKIHRQAEKLYKKDKKAALTARNYYVKARAIYLQLKEKFENQNVPPKVRKKAKALHEQAKQLNEWAVSVWKELKILNAEVKALHRKYHQIKEKISGRL